MYPPCDGCCSPEAVQACTHELMLLPLLTATTLPLPTMPPPAFPQVCRQLYAQEGLRGFSRGIGARVATMSTGSAVTWLTYESVKRWLARRPGPAHAEEEPRELGRAVAQRHAAAAAAATAVE